MTELWPPPNALDIGGNHRISFSHYQGEEAGIVDWHLSPQGIWCRGWIAFRGRAWANSFKSIIVGWDVIQREPLTLTPSLLCTACGSHGYITDGRWVECR
jgi:hypothetical protein